MRRTILASFLVIGAAIAVVFGASGTFAPFTATQDIQGTVASGKIYLDLADTGATANDTSLTFDLAAARRGRIVGGEQP